MSRFDKTPANPRPTRPVSPFIYPELPLTQTLSIQPTGSLPPQPLSIHPAFPRPPLITWVPTYWPLLPPPVLSFAHLPPFLRSSTLAHPHPADHAPSTGTSFASSRATQVSGTLAPSHAPIQPPLTPSHAPIQSSLAPKYEPISPPLAPSHAPIQPPLTPSHAPIQPSQKRKYEPISPPLAPSHAPIPHPHRKCARDSIALSHATLPPTLPPSHAFFQPTMAPSHAPAAPTLTLCQTPCSDLALRRLRKRALEETKDPGSLQRTEEAGP